MTGDSENAPVPGADPTRPSPGLGAQETDPATAAASEPTATGGARASGRDWVWISIGAATVLLILLIIFIAENSHSVTVSFLGASGHISLALALLIAAVAGMVVTLLARTGRILQLRRQTRRGRLRSASGGNRLQPH